MPMQDVAEQLKVLRRGVEAIVPEDEFVKMLERSARENAPLRVKYGIDPTGINVHLGHTVPLRKLKQFQDLGHMAVIIIGNYTALVGDPSGRDESRAKLSEAQVAENAKDYLRQVGRIIDLDRAEVHHNGDWFSKWSFLDVLELTRHMTLGQISARDDFAKRIAAEKPVYLHECLYPLMQGWDSVEVRADVELGGTEQLFSLMVARDLQQSRGQRPQVALTMPILVGTDGHRRMGKSLGNDIGIGLPPNELFGKIMSIPDEPLRQYFTLLTDLPVEEIDHWLSPEINPRDAKERLAKLIVDQYLGPLGPRTIEVGAKHTILIGAAAAASASSGEAEAAAAEFRRRSQGIDPENIPKITISREYMNAENLMSLARLIVELGFEKSTSNARRIIEQGGVNIGPERIVIVDPRASITVTDGLIVRVGKRKIAQVVINPNE